MPALATNKNAYRNYEIMEEYEAGIKLTGSEVKSAKAGQVDLIDAHVRLHNGEVTLLNCFIAPYGKASKNQQHDPTCNRKLLLRREEIKTLERETKGSNLTIIPIKMYTTRNLIKVKIGLARGRKKYEKKRVQKEREIERQVLGEAVLDKV